MPHPISGSKHIIAILFFTLIALAGCNSLLAGGVAKEDIPPLAIRAEEVANQIIGDFEDREQPLPAVITGPEGIRIAGKYTSDKKSLSNLGALYLVFIAKDDELVILACNPATGKKIFEDSTGTTKIDVRSWESGNAEECVPSLLR